MQIIGKRHRPLLVDHQQVITSCKGRICTLDLNSGESRTVSALPVSALKRMLVHSRVMERLLRIEAKAAIALSQEEILVSYSGRIYRVNLKTGAMVQEHAYRNGMNNPLYFSRIEGVEGFDDCIAYGEYTLNPQRKNPSGIFTRDLKTGEWKLAYNFEPGRIRHIHGIVPDPDHGCVYVLTGDLDQESGIWVARNNFRDLAPILSGSQLYRSGFLYQVEKGFVYPTDTALEQNYIYLLQKQQAGWTVDPILEIDGSCVSAAETARKVLVSTTVEADERVTGWKSWINCRRGPGIKSKAAQLIVVDKKTLQTKKLVEFEKDFFPYKLFQYGCMKVLDVPELKQILLYPIAVKKYDGKLLKLDYEEIEG